MLKILKKAQKEQLNLTFSEDLTAVSLVWTIFQTKPTTNDYPYYTYLARFSRGFSRFLVIFSHRKLGITFESRYGTKN